MLCLAIYGAGLTGLLVVLALRQSRGAGTPFRIRFDPAPTSAPGRREARVVAVSQELEALGFEPLGDFVVRDESAPGARHVSIFRFWLGRDRRVVAYDMEVHGAPRDDGTAAGRFMGLTVVMSGEPAGEIRLTTNSSLSPFRPAPFASTRILRGARPGALVAAHSSRDDLEGTPELDAETAVALVREYNDRVHDWLVESGQAVERQGRLLVRAGPSLRGSLRGFWPPTSDAERTPRSQWLAMGALATLMLGGSAAALSWAQGLWVTLAAAGVQLVGWALAALRFRMGWPFGALVAAVPAVALVAASGHDAWWLGAAGPFGAAIGAMLRGRGGVVSIDGRGDVREQASSAPERGLAAASLLVGAALALMAVVWRRTPMPDELLVADAFAVLAVALCGLGAGGVSLFGLAPSIRRAPWHRRLRTVAWIPLLAVIGVAGGSSLEERDREQTDAIGREVARAIAAFGELHGAPPPDLEALVPDHLPEVPRPVAGWSRQSFRYAPGPPFELGYRSHDGALVYRPLLGGFRWDER